MNCPGCESPMVEKDFEGVQGARIALDVCHECHGLWFDSAESLRLAPAGVLGVFREMHEPEPRERPRHPEHLECSRCHATLDRRYDMARNNRFHLFRCPLCRGHFIPFFQFLREKGLVRTLTARELRELRQRADTVRCSNCAAPVDLHGPQATCAGCQTPVSLLDTTGVEALLKKRAADKHLALGAAPLAGALQTQGAPASRGFEALDAVETGVDLVDLGLELLASLNLLDF